MKRGLAIIFISLILVSLFANLVSAVDANTSTNNSSDIGLYGFLKKNIKPVWDKTGGKLIDYSIEGIKRITGVKTFSGESMNWRHPIQYIEKVGYIYLLFGLTTFIWILIFFVLSSIFKIITISGGGPIPQKINSVGKKILLLLLFLLIVYPILMGIPLINRVLQILTLEILGMSMFLRSFIIAAIIYYAPVFFKIFRYYRLKTYYYDKRMKEMAGEEILKVHLKK